MAVRIVVIVLYALGIALAAFLGVVFSAEMSRAGWEWRIDYIAGTFIPIFLLMLFSTYAQAKAQTIRWSIVLIVLIAAITLFACLASHGFPGQSAIWGLVHIAVVGTGMAWYFLGQVRA